MSIMSLLSGFYHRAVDPSSSHVLRARLLLLLRVASCKAGHPYSSRGLAYFDTSPNMWGPVQPRDFITENAHRTNFSVLEFGTGEGNLLLDVQELAPNARVMGLNKPLPGLEFNRWLARDSADLRATARARNSSSANASPFPDVIMTQDTIGLLSRQLPANSTHLLLSNIGNYLSPQERSQLLEQTVRVLNDGAGLAYMVYLQQNPCGLHIGQVLHLKERRPLRVRCDRCSSARPGHSCMTCLYLMPSPRWLQDPPPLPAGCRPAMTRCRFGAGTFITLVAKGTDSAISRLKSQVEAISSFTDHLAGDPSAFGPLLNCLLVRSTDESVFHGHVMSTSGKDILYHTDGAHLY